MSLKLGKLWSVCSAVTQNTVRSVIIMWH